MSGKDFSDALGFLQYIPSKLAFAAVALVALYLVVQALLRSEVINLLPKAHRTKLIFLIVKGGFGLVAAICFVSFAWAIVTGDSQSTEIAKSVVKSAPANGRKSPEGAAVPPEKINDLARYIVGLTRGLSPPKGINEAVDELTKTGNAGPLITVLRDVQAQQSDALRRAETLRRIGLLAFYKDTTISLEAYQQSLDFDPENTDALTQVAFLRERKGDHAGAREAAEKAQRIGEKNNNREAVGMALNVLGIVAQNTNNLVDAANLFQKARGEFLAAGKSLQYARATNNLARISRTQGDSEAARRYYEEALSYDTKADNKRGIASDYIGLGQVFADQQEYDKSIEYYQKAYALSSEIDDLLQSAFALSNIGSLYRQRGQAGDLDRAKDALDRALALDKQTGNILSQSYTLGSLAAVAAASGNSAEAEAKYRAAIDLARGVFPFAEAVHQRGLGQLYLGENKLLPALDAFRRALALDNDGKAIHYAAIDQTWVADVLIRLTDKPDACLAWKDAAEKFAQAGNEDEQANVHRAMQDAACEN